MLALFLLRALGSKRLSSQLSAIARLGETSYSSALSRIYAAISSECTIAAKKESTSSREDSPR
jgi:hypothetical protein